MSYPHLGKNSPQRKKSKLCSKSAITKLLHVPNKHPSALATFLSRTSSRRHSIYDRIGRWHSHARDFFGRYPDAENDERPREAASWIASEWCQHQFAARCISGTSDHAVLPYTIPAGGPPEGLLNISACGIPSTSSHAVVEGNRKGSLSPRREESVPLSYGPTSAARGMTYMHEAYIAGGRPGFTPPVCAAGGEISYRIVV